MLKTHSSPAIGHQIDELPEGTLYPAYIPYTDRQVYAAWAKVREEICLACPFLKAFESGATNKYGQPGECCFSRYEEKYYDMDPNEIPLCEK